MCAFITVETAKTLVQNEGHFSEHFDSAAPREQPVRLQNARAEPIPRRARIHPVRDAFLVKFPTG